MPDGGSFTNINVTNFEILPDDWLERIAAGQINFDRAAFNRERDLWQAQGIKKYTFTQVHESAAIHPAATIPFLVDYSGTTPLSGKEGDMFKCFGGSIDLVYSRALSEADYWQDQVYKTDGFSSLNVDVSYNAEWHYPESIRIRIGLTAGGTYTDRWENVDIIEFKKLE
ncbi:hypothetical protein AGMMS50267_18220 [Spirochaetia bacterium]|nr:hypothetical protein AGMMS50267_18220 [Spirochaetia bacterium]